MFDNNKGNFNLPQGGRAGLYFSIAMIFLLFMFYSLSQNVSEKEVSYSVFLEYIQEDYIVKVEIFDERKIRGQLRADLGNGTYAYLRSVIPYNDEKLMPLLRESKVDVWGKSESSPMGIILINMIPWAITFLFLFWIFRNMQGGGNQGFSFGKSKARLYEEGTEITTFEDVAGQKEPKYELEEVVQFLKEPHRFTKIGARIPRGVLLVGPPGTGKTLLARAVAGEAGVAFYHMSGSDFVEMFVGVGASRVRDLFEKGRKNSPCILFIDELDAVGRSRGAGYGGGHDEREQTLNQLLVEMDGFDANSGIIVIAATNRPDVLDPALLRPGRFDRQVTVDLPDVVEREAILHIHTKRMKLARGVDLMRIARATPGCSGADLANIANEAALFAARGKRESVAHRDFQEAVDKVLMGVARKSRVMDEKDKRMTASHEAGHTLVHYFLTNSDPLHKVTIIPRGRALGMTLSLPEKDVYSHNLQWLKDRLVIFYGGYAAEDIVYGETTTGAQNDIKQATELARRMVCEWGMSPSLGPMALGDGDEPIFLAREVARHKNYSEDTARMVDREMKVFLKEGVDRAIDILREHRDMLDRLTDALVEQETLEDWEIRDLLGFDKNSNSGDNPV
ncbi:MAG: ATP-dependent zinc metalloprotease FtsH [Spirochaetales bacterium]|nr:ATP-dependent zinc metalloprotease FtsH [Spirochaetales bacterium]